MCLQLASFSGEMWSFLNAVKEFGLTKTNQKFLQTLSVNELF
jgi:hypothetical protein